MPKDNYTVFNRLDKHQYGPEKSLLNISFVSELTSGERKSFGKKIVKADNKEIF